MFGGATRDYSRPATDSISLVQTTHDTAKELRTGHEAICLLASGSS